MKKKSASMLSLQRVSALSVLVVLVALAPARANAAGPRPQVWGVSDLRGTASSQPAEGVVRHTAHEHSRATSGRRIAVASHHTKHRTGKKHHKRHHKKHHKRGFTQVKTKVKKKFKAAWAACRQLTPAARARNRELCSTLNREDAQRDCENQALLLEAEEMGSTGPGGARKIHIYDPKISGYRQFFVNNHVPAEEEIECTITEEVLEGPSRWGPHTEFKRDHQREAKRAKRDRVVKRSDKAALELFGYGLKRDLKHEAHQLSDTIGNLKSQAVCSQVFGDPPKCTEQHVLQRRLASVHRELHALPHFLARAER